MYRNIISRSEHEKGLITADSRNRAFANDGNGRPSIGHREIISSKIRSKVPITCASIKRELKWHKEAVGFYRRYVTEESRRTISKKDGGVSRKKRKRE